MKVNVKVIPRSKTVSIEMLENGTLKVKVRSSPEKGRANRELIEVLAQHYGVGRRNVVIESGKKKNIKRVSISC